MNPGKLNNIIKFYSYTRTADGFGGFTPDVSTLTDTMWGAATFTNGEIKNNDGKKSRDQQVEVILRKKDFDLVTQEEFSFTVDDVGKYKPNNYYEYIEDEYVKLIGTYEV